MRDRAAHKTRHARQTVAAIGPPSANVLPPAVVLALLIVFAVGATLVVHWPSLSARALSVDDDQYMTANPLVQNPSWTSAGRFFREVLHPSTVAGYYQPLAMISLMLDYAVAGSRDNLRPFHRTSLLLHAANTGLIILLLYMLLGRPWAAAIAGLLFGVHPMTVETIPWIGERKTLLATFFALWSLILYVRYARRPSLRAYIGCAAFYVLALLSKPTSTPLPVAMLLLDFWPLRRLDRRAVIEKLPLLTIGLAFAVVTVISQSGTAGVDLPTEHSFIRVPLMLCHNIVFYLQKIVWPARLSSYYAFPEPMALSNPPVLAGVVGTCALLALLVVSLRRTRAMLTGWLVFFVMILPAMGVLGFTFVIASDKYAYLPAIGLLLILAWLLNVLWGGEVDGGGAARRAGVIAVSAVIAFWLGSTSRGQLAHWRTSEELCEYTLSVSPKADPFLYHRGNLYRKKGDNDRAIVEYGRALAIRPTYAEAYCNRGVAFMGKRDYDAAIRDCTTAIELRPAFADAYCNRAVALMGKGDHDAAIRDCTKAVDLRPAFAQAYLNRGTACGMKGEFDRSIEDLTKAAELQPKEANAFRNRGNAYLGKGDALRAIADYTQAIAIDPTCADAYHGRAVARSRLKEYDLARADVRALQRLGRTPSAELRSLLESR